MARTQEPRNDFRVLVPGSAHAHDSYAHASELMREQKRTGLNTENSPENTRTTCRT